MKRRSQRHGSRWQTIRLRGRGLDRAKIELYLEWLEEGREPPPVRLARAGHILYVRDGRHRITAALVAGHTVIEADVRRSVNHRRLGRRAAAAPAPSVDAVTARTARRRRGIHGPVAGDQHVHSVPVW